MKLEEEIKQTKPFKSEIQKLILNISFTSSWLNGVFNEKLKPFDLSPPQYNVLRILKGNHPLSYSNQDIASRMIDRSSNATRIVDKLIEKMFVTRTENLKDRRQVNIKITERGLNILKKIEETPLLENTNMGKFNQEKARLMNDWLDELRQ